MTVTGIIKFNDIEEEVVVFIRNSDIFTITQRGVTTQSDTGTFSAASSHTLTTTPTIVKNVRSVVVGGSTLTRYTDYTVDYTTGVITFIAAQTGAYTISYDTGATDKVFPDFPKVELKVSSYPRIGVAITSLTTTDEALSSNYKMSDYLISIYVYSVGKENNNIYMATLREEFLESKTSFYYLKYVIPVSNGPAISEPNRAEKIITRTLELRSPLNMEVIS